jgi:hypothetical protein
MADDDSDIRVLTRFPKGADAETRRQFGVNLLGALNQLDIEPGERFIVAPEQPELSPPPQQERPDRDDTIAILLAILDYKKGLIDADEMQERVMLALREMIVPESAISSSEAAMMSLGNTGRYGT